MNSKIKGIVFYGVFALVALALWAVVTRGPVPAQATYSQFLDQVQAGQVSQAIILAANNASANGVTYRLKNGGQASTTVPFDYREALDAMQSHNVDIEIRDASRQWFRLLANATPFLVLLAFWFFMMVRLKQRPKAL